MGTFFPSEKMTLGRHSDTCSAKHKQRQRIHDT